MSVIVNPVVTSFRRLVVVLLAYALSVFGIGLILIAASSNDLASSRLRTLILVVWALAWLIHLVMSVAWVLNCRLHKVWPAAGTASAVIGLALFPLAAMLESPLTSSLWLAAVSVSGSLTVLALVSPCVVLAHHLVRFHSERVNKGHASAASESEA